jgi:ribosomal protein S18 acetylase RimI-like enzyme
MHEVSIEPLRMAEDRHDLRLLLASRLSLSWPVHGYHIERARLTRLLLKRTENGLARAGSYCSIARANGRTEGAICWSEQAWDSQQFGFPAGRVDFLATNPSSSPDVGRTLLERGLHQATHRGIRYMTATVAAGDLSTSHSFERAGFEIIDAIQTFALSLTHDCSPPQPIDTIQTRLFKSEDLPQVLDIARSSYVHDRFHADPAINSSVADQINEEWLRSSCCGTLADAVMVVTQEKSILGYVTCKIASDTKPALGLAFGSIGMVATCQNARERGVARRGTYAALEWFRSNNVDIVEVGTQLRNIPAARLYEKCGFQLTRASLTLRKLL